MQGFAKSTRVQKMRSITGMNICRCISWAAPSGCITPSHQSANTHICAPYLLSFFDWHCLLCALLFLKCTPKVDQFCPRTRRRWGGALRRFKRKPMMRTEWQPVGTRQAFIGSGHQNFLRPSWSSDLFHCPYVCSSSLFRGGKGGGSY